MTTRGLIDYENSARKALDGLAMMRIRPNVWLRIHWSDNERRFQYQWGPHQLTRQGALILIGEMNDA